MVIPKLVFTLDINTKDFLWRLCNCQNFPRIKISWKKSIHSFLFFLWYGIIYRPRLIHFSFKLVEKYFSGCFSFGLRGNLQQNFSLYCHTMKCFKKCGGGWRREWGCVEDCRLVNTKCKKRSRPGVEVGGLVRSPGRTNHTILTHSGEICHTQNNVATLPFLKENFLVKCHASFPW